MPDSRWPRNFPSQTTAPRRFIKDVNKAGRFYVPHMGLWLDVDLCANLVGKGHAGEC